MRSRRTRCLRAIPVTRDRRAARTRAPCSPTCLLSGSSSYMPPSPRNLPPPCPDAPTVVMEPQPVLMVNESSDSVNIYCTFNANPSSLVKERTKWFKDGRELRLKSLKGRVTSHFSGYPILTLNNVSRDDGGSYFCELANTVGVARPESPLELSVVHAPTVVLRVYPGKCESKARYARHQAFRRTHSWAGRRLMRISQRICGPCVYSLPVSLGRAQRCSNPL